MRPKGVCLAASHPQQSGLTYEVVDVPLALLHALDILVQADQAVLGHGGVEAQQRHQAAPAQGAGRDSRSIVCEQVVH